MEVILLKKKKKKIKSKIHPYTQESLKRKDKSLKIALSITESLLLLPVADTLLNLFDFKLNRVFALVIIYFLFLLFFYLVKIKSKRHDFSKWEFLDDEVNILTDRRLDGEVKDFYINKFNIIIIANILVIIPLSLTFSSILASAVSLIFSLFFEEVLVNLIKFLLIVIIFKNFFKPSNNILVRYLDEKKELHY